MFASGDKEKEHPMKKIVAFVIVLHCIGIFLTPSSGRSWSGDTWDAMSRETIVRVADEMIDFSWSPLNSITNCGHDFFSDEVYHGIAYCEGTPQKDWSEFYEAVNGTSGGTVEYGNDSGGFVSISWKLPKRYTAKDFLCDARNSTNVSCGTHYVPPSDDFVHSLGEVGSGATGLLPGDALVSTDHILLFHSYLSDGSGILAMEQTTPKARYSEWTWAQLETYTPIRRNKVVDYRYSFKNTWGTTGSGNGQFNYPSGIAVDSTGEVFVTDEENHRVQKFSGRGEYLGQFGELGNLSGQFNRPAGIAIDSSGNIYVADQKNHRIQRFNSHGDFVIAWGYYGIANGQFNLPVAVAVNSSGDVYVVDQGNQRIQKFHVTKTSVTSVSTWGSSGSGDGEFNSPSGIALDWGGQVYVADTENHRIQKFDEDGNFLLTWGSSGTETGQFSFPVGVSTDSSGYVYVVDQGNGRVQKFDGGGNYITHWGAAGTGDGQFDSPSDIAVDVSGNAFVTDTNNNRVEKFRAKRLFPEAPTDLAATVKAESKISLSWQDLSDNETGFKVKRKAGVRGTYETIATVGSNATSYVDKEVTANTVYYYTIWAYNSAGGSAYSSEVMSYTVDLNVLSPNGGEIIPSGSTRTIEWEAIGDLISDLTYKVEYSTDGGSTWKLIAEGLTETTYDWTVPKPTKNLRNCLVRVKGVDSEGKKRGIDKSDSAFTIEVTRLTSPNGGEVWETGTTHAITWTTEMTVRDVARVKLFYSKDGGSSWTLIQPIDANPETFDWTIPALNGNKKSCLVKVILYDSSGGQVGADTSDDPFKIEVVELTYPNGGQTLTPGATETITWVTHNTIRSVSKAKLSFTKDGETWVPIETLDTNPGTHDWTVPSFSKERKKCRLKVTLLDDQGKAVGSDASDSTFTILAAP
jgi:uncharacterized protein YjiK/fibronectin type 3 domain-containing protein